jgi:hypothetical protein
VTEASIGPEPRWTEHRPPSGWLPRLDIAELWSYRELAFFLALRDLKLRYKQTVFGVSWAIIQPLAGMVLFSVVFDRLAGLQSEGIPCRQRRPLGQGLVRLRREELRRLQLRFSGLRQLPVQIDGARRFDGRRRLRARPRDSGKPPRDTRVVAPFGGSATAVRCPLVTARAARAMAFTEHLPSGAGQFAVNGVAVPEAASESTESGYDRYSRARRESACKHRGTLNILGSLLSGLVA